MKMFDVHVQKGDYGYMFSRLEANSKKKASEIASLRWDSMMRGSSSPTTQKAFDKLRKEAYNITVMPVDAMKGMIMFEDFGKLPSPSRKFIRDNKGKLREVV